MKESIHNLEGTHTLTVESIGLCPRRGYFLTAKETTGNIQIGRSKWEALPKQLTQHDEVKVTFKYYEGWGGRDGRMHISAIELVDEQVVVSKETLNKLSKLILNRSGESLDTIVEVLEAREKI